MATVLPLVRLVTAASDMEAVLSSGRLSLIPDEPIEVCLSPEGDGLYEIVDGHHRVAQAIREGRTEVSAHIYAYFDDEPYEKPHFDFAAAAA